MKKRTIIKIIIAILPIILNFILIPVQLNFSPIIGPTDVDEIRYGKFKGDYLISDGVGVVKIMDPYTRQILWKNNCPHFFFHDADLLPNGDVLIADTGGDKIIEINIEHTNFTNSITNLFLQGKATEVMQELLNYIKE